MDAGYLNAEMIKAEKRRLEIFTWVLVGLSIVSAGTLFLHPESLRATFRNPISVPLILFISVFMALLFELGRRWVIRLQRKKGRLPKRYYWSSIFIEVSIPAAWLIMTSDLEKTSALLDSPILFVFFILIIVSSLHLDFWISSAMGLLIGLFVAAFTYWVTHKYPIDFHLPVMVYYIRSFLYFLSGLCAGLVGLELKRRLEITYEHIQEKEKIEGLFNQQVSREVVDTLKEKTDFAARMNVSVLFLDIRDFTQRVQHLNPEEVNRFQNDFFSPIIEIVNANKGIVNQIMGDGLMATFGAPVADENHVLLAWNSINEILAYLESYRKAHQAERKVAIGMGLHCGEVLVGNIGTRFRKQFSISGTPVIIASRIEQLNKEFNSTVLISRPAFDRLADRVSTYESLGLIKLKGLDTEIELLKVQ